MARKLNPSIKRHTTNGDATREAVAKKTAATETIDDAWNRILALKNDSKTLDKLLAVRDAMTNGTIGREPESVSKKFSKAEALRLYAEVQESLREGKLKELVAKTPENYVLVTELSELATLVDEMLKEELIAVDTETTGLDVYVDVIVGVSISPLSKDVHYYIPIKPTEDERALDAEQALKLLKPLIEEERVKKVLHNAIYDIAMFERHGLKLKGVAWDTMSAAHLLNENESSYQLKELAPKYLGEPSDTFAELFGKNAKFAEIPLDVALVYGAKDTDLTLRLYKFQQYHLSKMPEMMRYYEEVEVPLIYAVYAMEREGFVIDEGFAEEYGKEMKAEIDALEKSLMEQLGDININSTQQLKPVLERLTGEFLPNLDAKKTLKPMKGRYPIIAELLKYRELNKLYGTYISVLPQKLHPITGRLHARFNAQGTVTGRFSSGGNGINLQNQPQKARKLFVAPEGKVIIGADWSAQEVRCTAYFTQEPALLKAFEEGRDPYATLASEYFKKPYEEVNKTADDKDTPERKKMKVGMLASLYGTGVNTLAQQLGGTPEEARKFLDTFFNRYKNVKKWIDETQASAKRNGYVWLDKKQRKRRLPIAKKKTHGYDGEVAAALRQGPNAVIQGTSSIQAKTTIVAVHRWIQKKEGWNLWCTVHDELLVTAPEDFTKEDLKEFEDLMLYSYVFGNVANGTDIEVMKRWGSGVSPEEWFNQREGSE